MKEVLDFQSWYVFRNLQIVLPKSILAHLHGFSCHDIAMAFYSYNLVLLLCYVYMCVYIEVAVIS